MTTTSTFQGMDRDARTSSKVLNPPGGGSSNIFGTCEDASPQRRPVRNNPDNVNRGNNDIMNQGGRQMPVVQDKGKAPRSGEDSFHNVFGNQTSLVSPVTNNSSDHSPSVIDSIHGNPGSHERQTHSLRKNPDTFSNVFGDANIHPQDLNSKLGSRIDNSYSRVFGDDGAQSTSNISASLVASDISLNSQDSPGYSVSNSTSNSSAMRSCLSGASSSSALSPQKEEGMNTSFNRVFGQYQASQTPKATRYQRAFDREAFNPITGEAYDSPKPQGSNEKVTEATAVVDPEPGANAESESQSDGAINTQPKEDKSVPAVPTDSDVKEHTSTRVSQPPGGRCTKLW